jgi:hypothetical protein
MKTFGDVREEKKNQQGKKCQKYDYFVHKKSLLF